MKDPGSTHFPEGSTKVCAEVAIEGRRRDVVEGRRLDTPESLTDIDADGGLLDFVVLCETLAFLDRPNILMWIFLRPSTPCLSTQKITSRCM